MYLAFVPANYEGDDDRRSGIEIASISIPYVSKVFPEDIEVDERVFKEINMIRTAMVLAKDIYGNS